MSGAIRIGFRALNDCAILAAAQACGMFEAEGLTVTLSREPSWANIRDKLAYGVLDAAHAPAPLPIVTALGGGPHAAAKLIAPMALGLNGNSMIAARGLAAEIGPFGSPSSIGAVIADAVRARAAAGRPPLTFGLPFRFSAHAYVLRQWLSEAGVDPDRDVGIVVAPPERLAEMGRSGAVDAFCVGAPWGQAAVLDGAGVLLFSDQDYWPHKPEKVLAVTSAFASAAPDDLQALLRAMMRAAVWADSPVNRRALIEILSSRAFLDAPAPQIESAFGGPLSAGHLFAAEHGTYPWPQHGQWFAEQMQRWGHAPRAARVAAESVYRPDLWRIAATVVGLPAPARDASPQQYAKVAGGG